MKNTYAFFVGALIVLCGLKAGTELVLAADNTSCGSSKPQVTYGDQNNQVYTCPQSQQELPPFFRVQKANLDKTIQLSAQKRGNGYGAMFTFIAVQAQSAPNQGSKLSPEQLSQIRKAPFSKMFTVGSLYAVKDKDFRASENRIGFFSLWGDVPSRNLLQVAVQYCFDNQEIATSKAYLAEMIIMDDDKDRPLVRIDKGINAVVAQVETVEPKEYVPYVTSPFYDPFWDPFWGGFAYSSATYLPPVQCSFGRSRFDLSPVKNVIARLPNKNLKVQLLFSNGISQNWHLGSKTVEELKKLPTIKQSLVKPIPKRARKLY